MATGTPPASGPTVIDGSVVPPGSPPVDLSRSTTDGKTISSQELFRHGDVVISREKTLGGDQFADQLVIGTGAGDDNVQVSQRRNGVLDVSINGQPFEITPAPHQKLGVRSGDGNDVIQATPNVRVDMDVQGGDGHDTITTGRGRDRVDGGRGNDKISTGDGRDDVFGNSGNDTIDAGDGNDVVYGGDGNDLLRGGKGHDYLEGGRGADTLEGGRGNDILSGGRGNDSLRGDQGNDRVYTGAGADSVDNRSGRDTVFGQAGEDSFAQARGARTDRTEVDMSANIGGSIQIAAGSSDGFRQRAEADLDLLRASPVGRQTLSEQDRIANSTTGSGYGVTLTELQNEMNGRANPSNEADAYLRTDASGNTVAGPGTSTTIQYNPSLHSEAFRNPVGVLKHELSHAYNFTGGTLQDNPYTGRGPDGRSGVHNGERQAVGLDNGGLRYDFDRNPATAPTTANPLPLSENGLRREMGLPLRDAYDTDLKFKTTPGSNLSAMPNSLDAQLDRLIGSMQAGDRGASRDAMRAFTDNPIAQDFRRETAQTVDRQHQQAQAAMPTLPAEPVLAEPAHTAGGMRR